jgi:hypothetical protein
MARHVFDLRWHGTTIQGIAADFRGHLRAIENAPVGGWTQLEINCIQLGIARVWWYQGDVQSAARQLTRDLQTASGRMDLELTPRADSDWAPQPVPFEDRWCVAPGGLLKKGDSASAQISRAQRLYGALAVAFSVGQEFAFADIQAHCGQFGWSKDQLSSAIQQCVAEERLIDKTNVSFELGAP